MENIYQVIDILHNAKELDKTVDSVLKYIGETLNVSRTYVFEISNDGDTATNTFEWCAKGISHQKNHLSAISMKEYGFSKIFKKTNSYICPDVDKIDEPLKTLAKEEDVKALLLCALREEGKLKGFIGVDDCDSIRKDWMQDCEDMRSLILIAGLLGMFLLRERSRQHAVAESFLRIADAVKYRAEIDRTVETVQEQTTATLMGAHMGMWNIVLGEGEPQFFVDSTTALLVGTDLKASPEETYQYWYSNVDEEYKKSVTNCVDEMLNGLTAEVTYPYHHPTRGTIVIRCGGMLDDDYVGDGKRLRGYHQDITAQEIFNEQLSREREMFRNALTRSAKYSFTVDITEGIVTPDSLDEDNLEKLESLGIEVPMNYDELATMYEKKRGIKFVEKADKELLTINGLRRRYQEGATVENADLYENVTDSYYKAMIIFSKNASSDHLMAIILCTDVTTARKNELEQQQKLKEALERERRGRVTLTSIALIYNSMHLLNLDSNTYTELSAPIRVHSYIRSHIRSGMQDVLNGLVRTTICSAHVDKMVDFVDLSTVEDRLVGKTDISIEVITDEGKWWSFSFIRVGETTSKLKQVIFVSRDIDEEKRKEENLVLMSNTDELTKLSNRHAYENAVAAIMEKGLTGTIRILSIDLNGLKIANDTKGHNAGDELLIATAECGRAAIEPFGRLYRVGGDEFAAILDCSDEELKNVLNELRFQMTKWSGRYSDRFSFSVGAVSAKEFPGLTIDELEVEADKRMYQAKKAYYDDSRR